MDQRLSVKLEFAVQMTCSSCETDIRNSLQTYIIIYDINHKTSTVLVETTMPTNKICDLIESTGRRAVLRGIGSNKGLERLPAAVAMVDSGDSLPRGVVRFTQLPDKKCLVDGVVDGISASSAFATVNEFGDLSDGCRSCGEQFLPQRLNDASLEASTGRWSIRRVFDDVDLGSLIGRSLVINESTSQSTPAQRVACGIIARSAGLFENPKSYCACDGVPIWNERDVPLAGSGRQGAAATNS